VDPQLLVGLASDGAAVMVATGRKLGIIHQLCLGKQPCVSSLLKSLFSFVFTFFVFVI
jgi:hypothetical protein